MTLEQPASDIIDVTNYLRELFSKEKIYIMVKVPRLDITVYFYIGKYDLTVNNDLAKIYMKKLEASIKGFYTSDKSAYSPIFEEPLKLKEILIKDVLNFSTTLADK